MNQESTDKSKMYREFRYNEMRENGIYTDIKRLSNQAEIDYISGYTQAVTDLFTSNTQLREALRELEEDTRFLPKVYRDMMLSISKAKQLLTDNTQDNEKDKI